MCYAAILVSSLCKNIRKTVGVGIKVYAYRILIKHIKLRVLTQYVETKACTGTPIAS